MKKSRLAITGMAVLATLTLASGCVNKPSTSNPATLKPAIQVLTEAAEKTKGQPFTYTLTYGEIISGDGARDDTGNAQRNLTVKSGASGLTIGAKLLHIGPKVWGKLDLGSVGLIVPGLAGIGDRWLVVNLARLNANGLSASLIPGPDSSTVDSFVAGVITAENVSATEVKGTADLTRSAPIALPASEVAKLSADQQKVAFTATVDSQGRIVKTVLTMPTLFGYPAAPLTTNYTDFGVAVTIAAPAESNTVDAPDAIYLVLP